MEATSSARRRHRFPEDSSPPWVGPGLLPMQSGTAPSSGSAGGDVDPTRVVALRLVAMADDSRPSSNVAVRTCSDVSEHQRRLIERKRKDRRFAAMRDGVFALLHGGQHAGQSSRVA